MVNTVIDNGNTTVKSKKVAKVKRTVTAVAETKMVAKVRSIVIAIVKPKMVAMIKKGVISLDNCNCKVTEKTVTHQAS